MNSASSVFRKKENVDEYWHVLRAGKNFLSIKAKEETITNFLYQKDKQNQKIYDKVGKTSAWWQTLRVLTNPLKNTLMEEWIQNTKRQFERLNTNGQWLRAVRHIFMLRFSLSNNPRSTHLKDGCPILGGYGEGTFSDYRGNWGSNFGRQRGGTHQQLQVRAAILLKDWQAHEDVQSSSLFNSEPLGKSIWGQCMAESRHQTTLVWNRNGAYRNVPSG